MLVANDVPAMVENIFQVLPDTETVAVVIGSSPLERFWRAELGRELRPFESRVRLLWWDDLTSREILDRAAELPPRSAILYTLFLVDSAGISHASQAVLSSLHDVASAPVFGLFDTQLGQGVVGGPVMSIGTLSTLCAEAAMRAFSGASRQRTSASRSVSPGPPVFDWRELERWGIRERDLPPGSTIRFRPPPPWVQYRWPVLGGLSIIAILTGLVIGLLVHRARRRVAEREVRALSQRLLTASEDERRWLARELHDDLAQRLARLAIDAARLERADSVAASGIDLGGNAPRDRQHELTTCTRCRTGCTHPCSTTWASRRRCAPRPSASPARESIAIELRLDELTVKPSPDAALCLYRVAQESLRNVVRHARAGRVEISLRTTNGGCELEVRDNGVGFDPQKQRTGPSLGHASMRERVQLVGRAPRHPQRPAPRDHRRGVGAAAEGCGVSRPRILLADDHPIVAEGLQSLLAARFDVVGVVGDGQALLEAARSLEPDVVVADISMPLVNGIEATRRLAARSSPRSRW